MKPSAWDTVLNVVKPRRIMHKIDTDGSVRMWHTCGSPMIRQYNFWWCPRCSERVKGVTDV